MLIIGLISASMSINVLWKVRESIHTPFTTFSKVLHIITASLHLKLMPHYAISLIISESESQPAMQVWENLVCGCIFFPPQVCSSGSSGSKSRKWREHPAGGVWTFSEYRHWSLGAHLSREFTIIAEFNRHPERRQSLQRPRNHNGNFTVIYFITWKCI